MIDVPSMAELYAEVDAAFRAAYPDAPTRLSARQPEDAAWRRRWLALRDKHLHREVDRIYWARHPEAPLHLEVSNPVHEGYRQVWLDIRQALWDNAPEPPSADDDTIDLSYLRAGVNDSLLRFLPEIRPELHDDVRAFTDQCIDEAAYASDDEGWTSPVGSFVSIDDPAHGVEAFVEAWWAEGVLQGFADVTVYSPVQR